VTKQDRQEGREKNRRRSNDIRSSLQRHTGGDINKIISFKVRIVDANALKSKKTHPLKVPQSGTKTNIFYGTKIPRISKKDIQLRNDDSLEKNEDKLTRYMSTERIQRVIFICNYFCIV
jgi:hypothetical protein